MTSEPVRPKWRIQARERSTNPNVLTVADTVSIVINL
jgi:hypothetical protein